MNSKTPDDFMVSKLLGEDGETTVVLARDTSTNEEFAIKIIEKKSLEKGNKRSQFEKEKEIITLIDHPFFVKLHHMFEDQKRLYFALSFVSGGDILSYIETHGGLTRSCVKHYAAELVLALEYLRQINIVHRDLRPESILLTSDMHIKISDFGSAVKIKRDSKKGDQKKVSSIDGPQNYTAPEIISTKTCNLNTDIWSLGCIIYHMLTGHPITTSSIDNANKYEKHIKPILKRPGVKDDLAIDLISALLVVDPTGRLGSVQSGGYRTLMEHEFFDGLSWKNLPFQPPPITDRSSSIQRTNTGRNRLSTSSHFSESTVARLSPNKTGTMKRETKESTLKRKPLRASEPDDIEGYGVPVGISSEERDRWLSKQRDSTWHHFTDGALILKRAELDKKRGLSVKTRQFILMEGPRFIYVETSSMEVKGEIPWSRELEVQIKSFKSFNISVPGRTYHLVDKTGNATLWCRKIESVKAHYYG